MRRGFTITEVMITVTILTALGVAVFMALTHGREGFFTIRNYADIYANARRGIEEMVRDIRESDASTLTKVGATGVPLVVDPLDSSGNAHPILIFANARDSSGIFQLGADSQPIWQGVEVIYHYVDFAGTSNEVHQLRSYIERGQGGYTGGAFPFSNSVTVTDSTITIISGIGRPVTIARAGGRVLANFTESENFSVSDSDVYLELGMNKALNLFRGGGRASRATLKTSAQMRNR